jgi:5'-nucleotidase
MFRRMEPLPGVSEALWELSDLGVWIRIITHRLIFNWAHETSAADTAAWLDAHRIPYRDLCFIGDKPNVGADLYVDDSPTNILSLRAAGKTAIVFDQPYNRELPGPRAADWSEVVARVRAELDARDRQVPLPLTLPEDRS